MEFMRKKTLKTCIFLVNIELGSAPKKMLIFLNIISNGEGGREVAVSLENVCVMVFKKHFFQKEKRREGEGGKGEGEEGDVSLYKCV